MANYSLTQIAAAQTITTTTELVVAVVTVLSGSGDVGIWFSGDVKLTTGAGTTAVTIRLRQGNGISGTIIDSTAALPIGAAVTTQAPFNLFDTSQWSSQAGGGVYSLTVQQTGATGNGTVNGGHLGVEI